METPDADVTSSGSEVAFGGVRARVGGHPTRVLGEEGLMRRLARTSPWIAAWAVLVACSWCFAQTAPYSHLTNKRSSFTNFNVETVRGIAFHAGDQFTYGLNTHGSQIVVHEDLDGVPEETWPTVQFPASLAIWGNKILVAGGGTHCIVQHDRLSGRIEKHLALPSEPADLIVDDENGWAFVSCQGADTVVQIDLASFGEVRRFDMEAQRPRFLHLDRGDENDPTDNRVFVAPMLSGNNTTFFTDGGPPRIVDLYDANVAPNGGLPDEDLYCLDPFLGTCNPVLTGVGTLLMDHGRHPTTGDYWLLNLDARNQDPTLDTEPELNGIFIDNRLTIASGLTHSSTPFRPTTFVDIDDRDPQTPAKDYTTNGSLSFPYSLEFANNGLAFIASSTGDRVGVFTSTGVRARVLNLPDGSIPRDLAIDPWSEDLLFVYCWGTNVIQVFSIQPLRYTPVATLSLGFDPTPPAIQEGREIWYDAHRSLHGRSTCNSCHPNGGMDLLAWPISETPVDHKSIMVTQSLMGIEDTFPYHWRGERDLTAFNGAFVGLLGGPSVLDETPGGDRDKFYDFIFSLQSAANPQQNPSRVLDVALAQEVFPNSLAGNPIQGQLLFDTLPTIEGHTCESCHTGQTGSNGDVRTEAPSSITTERVFEVAHLRELTDKEQDEFDIKIANSNGMLVNSPRARNGFGFLHSGLNSTMFRFVDRFSITDQQTSDITAFVLQFDEGISPGAHLSYHMDASNASGVAADIQSILLPQVAQDWVDVVVFGVPLFGIGQPMTTRWQYDSTTGLFDPEYSSGASIPLSNFVSQAQLGASFTFLGLAPGNGRRFGIDHDDDGALNGDEMIALTDPWNPDSDGDGWPDGYEIKHQSDPNSSSSQPTDNTDPELLDMRLDFATTSFAKFFFEASEPVRYRVDYGTTGGVQRQHVNLDPVQGGTLVLQKIEHSTPGETPLLFQGTIELTDLSGNSKTFAIPSFESDVMIVDNDGASFGKVIGDLQWTSLQKDVPQGTVTASAQVRVDLKRSGPPGLAARNQVVIFQVLVEDSVSGHWQVSNNFTTSQQTSFKIDGTVYDGLPGTFLVSPVTNNNGLATVDFVQAGLQAGQRFMLNVVTVLWVRVPQAYDPLDPDFDTNGFNQLGQYHMPLTPPQYRNLVDSL